MSELKKSKNYKHGAIARNERLYNTRILEEQK